jgi:hypothetical protein
MNDIQFNKINGRWSVSRKGCILTGYLPYTVIEKTMDVNLMGDFNTKKFATAWVKAGCPIDDIEKAIGVTKIVWAKTFSEAQQLATLPDTYLAED